MTVELVIVGDEAWTAEEYEADQPRREKRQAWEREYRRRRYHDDPEYRARYLEYQYAYRRQPYVPEREAQSPKRLPPLLVGSLHSLACTGPTQVTGCRCKKVKMYNRPPR